MSIIKRIYGKVQDLSRLYMASKLRIACQIITCLAALGSIISLSINFTSKSSMLVYVFEYILNTVYSTDVSLRMTAQGKFMQFMSKFCNVLDVMLMSLLMLVVSVRTLFKNVATYDWFINACNLVLLGAVFGKVIFGLASDVCRILDRKYMLVELSDYNSFTSRAPNSPNQPDPTFNKNLSMMRQEKENPYDNFQKQEKYQQFVEEEMVQRDDLNPQGFKNQEQNIEMTEQIQKNKQKGRNFIVFNQERNDAL